MKRTLTYKTSTGCNLGCTYCYERRRLGGLLHDKTIPAVSLIEKIEDLAESNDNLSLMLCLHGGEPLLMGVDAYSSLCERLITINKLEGKRIAISLQTNGTLLTPEWVECFSRYQELFSGNGIGISLDGDEVAQNTFRKTLSGEGSYNLVVDGISNLKQKGLSFGLLAVVSRPSLPRAKRIYEAMTNLSPVVIKFVPCYDFLPNGNYAPYSVTPLEFVSFLKEIFTYWIKSGVNVNRPVIEPLFSSIMNYQGRKVSWCEYNDIKCEDFLLIDANGTIGYCDNLPEFTFPQNIKNVDLDNLLRFELLEFSKVREKLRESCKDCSIFSFCKGGCLGTRYNFLTKAATNLKDDYCNGKKVLFELIGNVIKRIS